MCRFCLALRFILAAVVLWLLFVLVAPAYAGVPEACRAYQRRITQEAYTVFGLTAPIAALAAQVQQESGCRANAMSPVGASGLTQFMPATAADMSKRYPELGPPAPFDPRWAIAAQMRYMRELTNAAPGRTECETWAFGFSAYNGGNGNLSKDKRLCLNQPPAPGYCGAGETAKPEGLGLGERHLGTGSADFADALSAWVFFELGRGYGRTHFSPVFGGFSAGYAAQRHSGSLLGSWFLAGAAGQLLSYRFDGIWRVLAPVEVVGLADPLVLSVVSPLRHGGKIRRVEVASIMINVVNNRVGSQYGPVKMGGDQPMHVLDFFLFPDLLVSSRVAVQQKRAANANSIKNGAKVVTDHGSAPGLVGGKSSIGGCSCDATRWFGNVEKHSGRSKAAFIENRDYPRRILLKLTPIYAAGGYGRAIVCPTN